MIFLSSQLNRASGVVFGEEVGSVCQHDSLQLSKMPSLWTRSYFVSTAGNVCSETTKRYVENQKKRY